jgi:ribose 5-phosphate isomerase B
MIIAFGCDHAGFPVKADILAHLKEAGIQVLDFGTFSDASCAYPDFAFKAAQAVVSGKADKGILVCGSGEGMAIAANKVKGIRCGIGYNDTVSDLMVEHNHANMIAFGARYMTSADILRRIDIFLKAAPQEGRHQERVDIISEFEDKSC